MSLFHLFQIDHDRLTPREAQAAFRASFGHIELALAAGLHGYTGAVEAADIEATGQAVCHGPSIYNGDVAVDTESVEAWVRTPGGWEQLSYDRFLNLMVEVEQREARRECELEPC